MNRKIIALVTIIAIVILACIIMIYININNQNIDENEVKDILINMVEEI